jgi:hypothetical protein
MFDRDSLKLETQGIFSKTRNIMEGGLVGCFYGAYRHFQQYFRYITIW